ncbi:nucleotide exchange factor GrpE, partial [Agrococcus sp. HG114]|nr:nucleotide exchange factor GrpE [Agrococcus sp. HG114]
MADNEDKQGDAEGREEPKVHDKRRIDPVTGEPREPASAGSGAAPAGAADASAEAGGDAPGAQAAGRLLYTADAADGPLRGA